MKRSLGTTRENTFQLRILTGQLLRSIFWITYHIFNQFKEMSPLYTRWNIEKLYSFVFRAYREETLAWNRLKPTGCNFDYKGPSSKPVPRILARIQWFAWLCLLTLNLQLRKPVFRVYFLPEIAVQSLCKATVLNIARKYCL